MADVSGLLFVADKAADELLELSVDALHGPAPVTAPRQRTYANTILRHAKGLRATVRAWNMERPATAPETAPPSGTTD